MITSIGQALDRRAPAVGIPKIRSGVVLGPDRDPAAKVTLLLFGPGRRPVAVAKTTRGERESGLLEHEYDTLVALARSGLPRTYAQIPRPLLLDRIDNRVVLVTAAVPGVPLLVRYHSPGHVRSPRHVGADLAMAGRWLARFQHDTAQDGRDCQEAYGAHADAVFARYRAAHGWGSAEQQLSTDLRALAASLSGVRIPMVAVHGDYCIGNVLTTGSAVTGVVDWELGQGRGLPFTDVFKLAASYASFLDRAVPASRHGLSGHPGWGRARDRWGATSSWPNLIGFLYAFKGSGWFADIVDDYLADAYERLGVPPQAGELFLPLFVAEQATTLADPVYRRGYRDLLRILASCTSGPPSAQRVAM